MTRSIHLTLAASLGLALSACDEPSSDPDMGEEDALEESLETEFERGRPVDPELFAQAPANVVARVVVDELDVQFVERADPEDGDPVIDVAIIVSPSASDFVSPWLEDGATPLEVLLALDSDAEVPDSMRAHHVAATAEAGRDSEVRELTTWRDDSEFGHDDDICGPYPSYGLFLQHVWSIMDPYDVDAVGLVEGEPIGARSVSIFSTKSSGKNVPARVCNPQSYGGCYLDRFSAYVYALGAHGSGTYWQGQLTDCDLLKFWWGKRVANTQYGVVLDQPQYLSGGGGWLDCNGDNCGPIQAYLAVGLRI